MVEVDELTHTTKYVESELTRRLKSIEDVLDCDVITCIHPISQPMDDLIRDYIEDIQDKRKKLLVIIETNGGSIDPQVRNRDGQFVPALGYLEKYDELMNRSSKGSLSSAELAFLIQKFDPAQIHRFEQARDHSVDLLKKWLVQYKFKNWAVTETGRKSVSGKMREARASEIAKKLNDTKRWRSHGRGLSIDVLKGDLNLLIENFGAIPELNRKVRSYYRLLQDHMTGIGVTVALQTRERFVAM